MLLKDVSSFEVYRFEVPKGYGDAGYIAGIEKVLEDLDKLPTIDVVRCGECKYADDSCARGVVCICSHGGMCGTFVADTDFCSCGKRRMDGE